MNALLMDLKSRFDACSDRERLLVAACVLVVPLLAWDTLVRMPMSAWQDKLGIQLDSVTSNIESQNTRIDSLTKVVAHDPDSETRKQLSAIKAELKASHAALQSLTDELVDPKEMSQVLEDLLSRNTGLTLISLENQPVSSLQQQAADKADGVVENTTTQLAPVMLYRHGLTLQFEGSYLDVLAYLKAVEALPWKLFWGDMNYEVLEHPKARVTINVHTLSLGEDWIGG